MCGLYTREINLNPYLLYSQQLGIVMVDKEKAKNEYEEDRQ